jgi:diacylglycerol kinase family enzyme
VENPEVTVLRGSEVEIKADRPFAMYADGDHVADLPATVRVLPRALDVIAPPDGAPSPRPR